MSHQNKQLNVFKYVLLELYITQSSVLLRRILGCSIIEVPLLILWNTSI